MTDQQISNRGLEASQILASQAYIDAMAALRKAVVDTLDEAPLRDEQGRLILHMQLKMATTFERLLSGYIEAGKYAAHKLEMDELRNESPARKIVRRFL